MAAVASTCRAAPSDGIKMALITPQAVKLFQRLSATDRRCVSEALSKPVHGDRYRTITHLRKPRVRHFDVTETIRVSYRLLGAQACVLHIGTHSEFKRFSARYTGTLPNTLISIEESFVMSQKHMSNGIPFSKVEPTSRPSVSPIVRVSDQDVAETLAQLLLGSRAFEERAKSIDDTIETLMDDVRDMTIAKVGGDLQNIEGRIADQGADFERLRGAVGTICGDVTALQSRMADHRGEIEAGLEAQTLRIASVEVQLAGAVGRFDRDVAAVVAEDRTAPLVSRLDRLATDSEGFGRRLVDQDASLAGTHDALDTCRADLDTLRSMLAESDARSLALNYQVAALHASLNDLLARLDQERQEATLRTFKARWLGLVGTVRCACTGSKRPRSIRQQS